MAYTCPKMMGGMKWGYMLYVCALHTFIKNLFADDVGIIIFLLHFSCLILWTWILQKDIFFVIEFVGLTKLFHLGF